jgi:hypothetical protein
MNPDYEKRLEQAIADKLAALPQLSAPDELAERVMSTLSMRAALPWYRKSWHAWPPVWKAVSLLLMLASFGALCFAGGKVSDASHLAKIIPQNGDGISTLNLIWNTLSVLASASLLALKQLVSPIFLIAFAAIAALSYAICIGLGTLIFRYTKRINYEN